MKWAKIKKNGKKVKTDDVYDYYKIRLNNRLGYYKVKKVLRRKLVTQVKKKEMKHGKENSYC